MLHLVFNLGNDSYALPVDRIRQIIPFIKPKAIRGAPAVLAGAIRYHGRFLPVVDLVQLETGQPASLHMGTRIIVTEVRIGERMETLGLVIEKATEMLRCQPEAFKPFAASSRGLVQLIDLENLLPAQLFDGFPLELETAQ